MTARTPSSPKKSARLPFPQQLFQLLREEDQWEQIISWVNNGTGFKVHDRPEFEKVLLPRYFNTTRYASFTRQLCAYGFDCVRTGRQTGIYSHPRFRRDFPDAVPSIKRDGGKPASKEAISEHNQSPILNLQPVGGIIRGLRTSDGLVRFPSLMLPPNRRNEGSNHMSSPMFASLLNTVRSQVADRNKKVLPIGVPSGMTNEESLPFASRNSGMWSLSATGVASSNMNSQVNVISDLTKSDGVLGSFVSNRDSNPRSSVSMKSPTPTDPQRLLWSPIGTPGNSSDEEEEDSPSTEYNEQVLTRSLEPRSIQDMVQNPVGQQQQRSLRHEAATQLPYYSPLDANDLLTTKQQHQQLPTPIISFLRTERVARQA